MNGIMFRQDYRMKTGWTGLFVLRGRKRGKKKEGKNILSIPHNPANPVKVFSKSCRDSFC